MLAALRAKFQATDLMSITQSLDGGTLTLKFAGDFVLERLADVEADLFAVKPEGARNAVFDVSDIGRVDISGVWVILARAREMSAAGVPTRVTGARSEHFAFLQDLATGKQPEGAAPAPEETLRPWVRVTQPVGIWTLGRARDAVDGLAFVGRIVMVFLSAGRSLKRLRAPSIVRCHSSPSSEAAWRNCGSGSW